MSVAIFSASNSIPNSSDTDKLINDFNLLCTSTLDSVAPFKTRTKRSIGLAPWMNNDIRTHTNVEGVEDDEASGTLSTDERADDLF